MALNCRLPLFVLAWSLMRRSGEACITAPTASAFCNDNSVVRTAEVVNNLASILVVDDRPDRNFQDDVFAFGACPVRTLPVASALGFVFGIKAEMNKRVVLLARFHDHVAASTTIATRRTAARDEFLAPEGHAAVAAATRSYPNFGLINKHL